MAILETILDSGALLPGIALGLGLYIAWLLLSANRFVQLPRKEIRMLWKFHKQKTGCKAKKWSEIVKKNKPVGFECECGFKHIQKKPLVNVSLVR